MNHTDDADGTKNNMSPPGRGEGGDTIQTRLTPFLTKCVGPPLVIINMNGHEIIVGIIKRRRKNDGRSLMLVGADW